MASSNAYPSLSGDRITSSTNVTPYTRENDNNSDDSRGSSVAAAVPLLPTTLSTSKPIPLSAYISVSQAAISSGLQVAKISTSMSLGIARTIVSSIDKILGFAVKGVTGQSGETTPGCALLGINLSDLLVQTILETVDGSVNLALGTVQDGLDLMESLFGPDSTSQTGETFREVWAIVNREFTPSNGEDGGLGGYPALEGMHLFMAYIAIQFATSEQWETIRVRTQGRLIGECLESKDEELGSSTAWSALAAWPQEWTKGPHGLTEDELLEELRVLELKQQGEGRTAASFSSPSSSVSSLGTPNVELTNFLAASYRFSRFCSAMYGSMALEIMGAPERYPPPPPLPATNTATFPVPSEPGMEGATHPPAAAPMNESDHHFHQYTGTPLGSILYSSDTAATIHDGYYSPRYYLLDDVDTKQIVLVLRGTRSLHDVMIDLTCDASDLWLDHDTTPLVDAQGNTVAYNVSANSDGQSQRRKRPFKVHGGFLKAARTIASADTIGIQEMVKAALESRPDHSLLLIGHSLGAGIASVLSMLWADPATGLTPELPSHTSARSSPSGSGNTTPAPQGLASGLGVKYDSEKGQFYLPGYSPRNNAESFLPAGRRVRCYAYGSPKVMCPRMSKRAIKVVTSISFGDDVVGRLSVGSTRNIGHAMRALLAMRPPPPPSPPVSPSPPSSPDLDATSMDIELLQDSTESLQDLLEAEGEAINRESLRMEEEEEAGSPMTSEGRRRRRHDRKNKEKEERRKKKAEAKAARKPAQQSIGLEIVQKVIRWKLTGEERLLEEFMDIRRAMQKEMDKHQEPNNSGGDFYPEDGTATDSYDVNKITPVLIPAGKVLWIRPTSFEKDLENAETKKRPFESVLHQFDWDHPVDHNPASMLRRQLGVSQADSASSSSDRQSLSELNHPQNAATAATSFSLHSLGNTANQNTDKLLYRMYAVPEPENVFDEMLFSRRMWSDHMPLTYEFILAGKHAIPVTSPEAQKEKDEIVRASARGGVAV
ncbi:hypothetical protein BGZ98_001709 [Dissophora globulifera]|nr:hypothetical protein BGZ98_001709 [Dissophora globulifera]